MTLAATRQSTFDFYKNHDDPRFCITLQHVIPDVREFCRETETSVFQFLLFHLAHASLEVPHFRLRVDESQTVYEIDTLNVSYTVLDKHQNANFVIVPYDNDRDTFCRTSVIEKARVEGLDFGHAPDPRMNFLYVSAVPWFSFTGIQNALTDRHRIQIPIVVFGKFSPTADGELTLPISVQGHHGLIDGLHIAQFLEAFRKAITATLSA